MTKFAIFDTETSGLFDFSRPADAEGQPRLAHLNIILLDEQMVEEDVIDLYVKPDGWEMQPDAQAINGLTDEFLDANGTPIAVVLAKYAEIIDQGYALAAYNAQYDTKVMRGEMRRLGIDDRFEATPNVCIMRACGGLKIQKADGGRGWPKLSDCCAHFGIDHNAAHTAGGDTRAALEVFLRLHALGALPDARVHYAKNRPDSEAA